MSGRRLSASGSPPARASLRFSKAAARASAKPRPSRQRRLDPYGEDILRWIKETPDPTLQELSERLDEVHQVIAPTSTINDWFRARKISF